MADSALAIVFRETGRAIGRLLLGIFAVGIVAVTSLKWLDPITSSIIIQENLVHRRALADWVNFDWRPRQQISDQMALAVIAAEDQRFPTHHGLDFVELKKALQESDGQPRGASTLTQQVAKNMFLWGGRSYFRKAVEAAIALYIDLAWGKQRVLEVYLNVAQFGPDVFGVENASHHYFDKSANALNRYEAARLAAVLPNPNTRSAAHASGPVMQRQQWIMEQMALLEGRGMPDEL